MARRREFKTIPVRALAKWYGSFAPALAERVFEPSARGIYDKRKVNALFKARKSAGAKKNYAAHAELARELAHTAPTAWDAIVAKHGSPRRIVREVAFAYFKTCVNLVLVTAPDAQLEFLEDGDVWPATPTPPLAEFACAPQDTAATATVPSPLPPADTRDDAPADDLPSAASTSLLDIGRTLNDGPVTLHRVYINANVVESPTSKEMTIKIGTTADPGGGGRRLGDAHAGEFANLFNFTMALPPGECERITAHFGETELNGRDVVEALLHEQCTRFALRNAKRARVDISQREMFRIPRATLPVLVRNIAHHFPLRQENAERLERVRERCIVRYDDRGFGEHGAMNLLGGVGVTA